MILPIRSRQVQKYRQEYGYDVYTAEGRRRKLLRWAGLALAGVITIAGVYIWQVLRSGGSAHVNIVPIQEERDPLAGMALIIPHLGINAKLTEAPLWRNSRMYRA